MPPGSAGPERPDPLQLATARLKLRGPMSLDRSIVLVGLSMSATSYTGMYCRKGAGALLPNTSRQRPCRVSTASAHDMYDWRCRR